MRKKCISVQEGVFSDKIRMQKNRVIFVTDIFLDFPGHNLIFFTCTNLVPRVYTFENLKPKNVVHGHFFTVFRFFTGTFSCQKCKILDSSFFTPKKHWQSKSSFTCLKILVGNFIEISLNFDWSFIDETSMKHYWSFMFVKIAMKLHVKLHWNFS